MDGTYSHFAALSCQAVDSVGQICGPH